MAGEDRQRELVITYSDLQEKITDAITKSSADTFFRSPLEDLQKTVNSMESMVEDMEQSEIASSRYIFMTRKFLPQMEETVRFLSIELPAASSRVGTFKVFICQALGIELPASTTRAYSYKDGLESNQKRLKNIFEVYVKEELDKLALTDQEVGDEVALRGLLRYLPSKIRDEALKPSSNPVFQNIKVILDSLETEFHNRRQHTNGDMFLAPSTSPLLHLLKEVKLLHRFLNGDHGLDIPNLLRERENALRNFVTNNVVSRLKQLDRKYEKLQREKEIRNDILMLLFVVASLALILSMPEKYRSRSNRDSVAIVFCIIYIILFYGILVMDVYNHIRSGRSRAQRQTLIIDNPCCGGFCLLSFVAMVLGVVVLAVAMVVTDEPKKYDIFLNFRGSDDIRYTVAGVFHSSLEKANFSTFFDERNSRKSKRFLKEIESAISTSVGAITIFSEYYGESEYCLDELLLILEREKTHKGYIIRPIFYDVEPDDLTNPESKFGQGLQKHYKTQRKDKVEEWKEALENVTLIGGDVHKRKITDFGNRVDTRLKTDLDKLIALKPSSIPSEKCPPEGKDKVVLYTRFGDTFNTKEAQDSLKLKKILEEQNVDFEERNLKKVPRFKNEVTLPCPKLFVKGKYVGGLEEVQGWNKNQLESVFLNFKLKEENRYLPCGEDTVVIYTSDKKGPNSQFVKDSQEVIKILTEQKIHFENRNEHGSANVKKELKILGTMFEFIKSHDGAVKYPIIFARGKHIGGLEKVKDLQKKGELKSTLLNLKK